MDGVSAFPRVFPTCVPVLDGVPAFPRSCPLVSPHACLCWIVRPVLSPIVSPHVCLCWMVCLPSQGLSPLVSTRLPSDGVYAPSHNRVSACLPLSPHVCVCGPVLEGVSAFPRPCLPFSPRLSPLVSPAFSRSCLLWSTYMCAFVGWCVRLLRDHCYLP